MNKKLLLILLLPLLWTCKKKNDHVDPNIVYIPDANFKAVLIQDNYINTNGDNEIQISEAQAATDLYIPYCDITDLTGIEKFTALKKIDCHGNLLSVCNLRYNTLLETLDCDDCYMNAIDISFNKSLKVLSCSSNNFNTLNLKSNALLNYLDCYYNNITILDLKYNTSLKQVDCSSCHLTSLILNDTALSYLSCQINNLTSLNINSNTKLERLLCASNQFTALDVRPDSVLAYLECDGNPNLPFVCITNAQKQIIDNNIITWIDHWMKDDACLWKVDCL